MRVHTTVFQKPGPCQSWPAAPSGGLPARWLRRGRRPGVPPAGVCVRVRAEGRYVPQIRRAAWKIPFVRRAVFGNTACKQQAGRCARRTATLPRTPPFHAGARGALASGGCPGGSFPPTSRSRVAVPGLWLPVLAPVGCRCRPRSGFCRGAAHAHRRRVVPKPPAQGSAS